MSAALTMPEDGPAPDLLQLNKELDKTKSAVFMGKKATFFGALMCSLSFHWDEKVETAATDGKSIFWAPSYFQRLPVHSRPTDLMHELWHVAKLHMLRRGARDPKIWNIACDIDIDLKLEADGYSFDGIQGVLSWPWLNARKYAQPWVDDQGKMHEWAEEDIYEDLVKQAIQVPASYVPDMQGEPKNPHQIINTVVMAAQQTKLAGGGGAGNMPGDVEVILKKFLAPVVPWEKLLHDFMQELTEEGYSWRQRNRRFPSIYLPSRHMDEGLLAHLMYFEDVSGSISDADNTRFNSEIKYVKDTYKPKQLTLVQFDTRITQSVTFNEEDPFEEIKIVGRGGTCLQCVRQHIIEHRPTAAIIFSDLECDPMEPLPFEIPIIWVAIRSRARTVPFGKLIHIRG